MESILEEVLLIFKNKTLMMEKIINKAVQEEINLTVISILLILTKEREEERKDLKQKSLAVEIKQNQKEKIFRKNKKKVINKLNKLKKARKTKL